MDAELQRALDKAKVGLMAKKDSTFLSAILFRLVIIITDEIPTAGTDGKNLLINARWFMSLSEAARIGLLAHETWHVALQHMLRGECLNAEIFNIACDYIINNMLDTHNYTLPDKGYMDHQYDDMTSEQVYALIYDKHKDDKNIDCDIIRTPGTGEPNPGDSNEKREALQDSLDNILIQAKLASDISKEKLIGNVPAEILRRLDELLNPKLPWFVILQNYVNSFVAQDYSFSRPKRKYQPDFILPSLTGDNIDHIGIGIDSSGSVSDDEFLAFLSEIQDIKDFCKPNRLTIIDFDSSIKDIHELGESDSVLTIPFRGYGGTDLFPPFEKALELNPDLFIVFSDMHCTPYTEETPFPVIWVVVNNPNASISFGQRVDMDTSS